MVAPVSISGKEGKLKGQLARAVAKLNKAKLGGNPQVIKAAELRVKELQKFGKKEEIGKPKKGDSPSMPKKPKTPLEQASIFDPKKGVFADIWKKKPDKEDTDWTKDYSKMWEKTGDAEEDAWLDDPGLGYKHGGRIKKAKKRKRAALRGHRAELRGG